VSAQRHGWPGLILKSSHRVTYLLQTERQESIGASINTERHTEARGLAIERLECHLSRLQLLGPCQHERQSLNDLLFYLGPYLSPCLIPHAFEGVMLARKRLLDTLKLLQERPPFAAEVLKGGGDCRFDGATLGRHEDSPNSQKRLVDPALLLSKLAVGSGLRNDEGMGVNRLQCADVKLVCDVGFST